MAEFDRKGSILSTIELLTQSGWYV